MLIGSLYFFYAVLLGMMIKRTPIFRSDNPVIRNCNYLKKY